MRNFEYRLYPTKAQHALFMACLAATRVLYNAMLEATTAHYRETGKFLFKYDLCARFKGAGGDVVPATVVQCLADRLDKALRDFLRRRELGAEPGFPRFKTPNRWHSMQLRQFEKGRDASIDGRFLRVPAKLGGAIKIKMHRPLEGTPKTCYLVLRADGHWYAVIACETEPGAQSAKEPDARPDLGLDVGLKVFLADSEGNTVANPRHFRKAQATLRRKQRVLCRRKKGSHRRRKAARNTAKTHLKIGRQRRDFHFKTAQYYAKRYRLIAVEELNVSGMVHGNLGKSIHDAGWTQFLAILSDKAAGAGGRVVRVEARFTTQKCSACGAHVQKSLSVRTHICTECGFVADRDVNAAKNILSKARAWPSGTGEDALPVELRSPRL